MGDLRTVEECVEYKREGCKAVVKSAVQIVLDELTALEQAPERSRLEKRSKALARVALLRVRMQLKMLGREF